MTNRTSELPCALVIMGVAGSGKSTIGDALARRLAWRYEDGDSFHPASNLANVLFAEPEKLSKPLVPLIHQLPSMNQHKRIYFTLGN